VTHRLSLRPLACHAPGDRSSSMGTKGLTLYQLNLSAIAPGESELYAYKGTATSTNAPSLPANGVKVYARLYSYINNSWQYHDYVYTEQ
jgi:hypothetical protein